MGVSFEKKAQAFRQVSNLKDSCLSFSDQAFHNIGTNCFQWDVLLPKDIKAWVDALKYSSIP